VLDSDKAILSWHKFCLQVFVTLPVQHGATVEQKLRSLIVEIFHRLPTSEARMRPPVICGAWVNIKEQTTQDADHVALAPACGDHAAITDDLARARHHICSAACNVA